jgi:hypothetical protein
MASTFVAWASLWSSFVGTFALLARCHLFSRQATTNMDILFTYSVVAFGLHFRFELKKSEKRHDLYWIASLGVVAIHVRASLTIFELSSVTLSWSERSLECSTAFQRKRGESERWRTGVAALHVQALAVEKRAKMLGESDRERKLHNT